MRNPNSYGQIIKLGGQRRRPFAVRITTGWTDDGKQIQKYLGYYEKRTDAIAALVDYHQNPYDFGASKATFQDVYEKWCKLTYEDNNLDVPKSYAAAFKRLGGLHHMVFADIRKRHMQGELDHCKLGYSTKKNMKTLCNKLYKLAIDCELVATNFATNIELPPKEESTIHHPFTPKELRMLWKHQDELGVQYALVYCYTGLRPTELLKITTDNVHLDEHYMMGGMKTAAGKNRVIPIADKIMPIITSWYNPDEEYLCIDPRDGRPFLNYDRLREHVWKRCELLAQHLPHDGRHTCATLLDNAEINLKVIQLILGHRSADITHRVYTHKTIKQLVTAINKI